MDDLIRQATFAVRAMWKNRWLGLGTAWVVALLGSAIVLSVHDRYMAVARIFIDTQSILKPLMSGLAVQPNVDQQLAMLSRTVISRPNVEKLIRMADLEPAGTTGVKHDELVDHVMKGLEIKTTSQDKMYALAYRDPDPEKAKRVVESLVSIFVDLREGETREDSAAAKKFIDDQIKVYEGKLVEAENRLKDFKVRHSEFYAGDGRGITERLAEVTAQLDKARLQLHEAEKSRDALKLQFEAQGLVRGADKAAEVSIPEIDSRIEAQKQNLDSLLQRYTEQHPDVVGTRRLLKSLEEQKRQEVAARQKMAAGMPAVAVSTNPVTQQLRISLAEAEADVASLHARVVEYESRYKRITDLMKTAPEVEAEYAQLNRDYDVHKRNYEGLVARRESANLAGALGAAAGVDDFKLIDPPRVAPRPVAPNRFVLMLGTLVVALAAGIFASLAVARMRPVFFGLQELREACNLPLLGSISLIDSEPRRQAEKTDLKRFMLGCASLVVILAAGAAAVFVTSQRVV